MEANPDYSQRINELESEFIAYKKSPEGIFSPIITSFPTPFFPSITSKPNPISC